MKVYEFWLREEFKEQVFEILCETFYNIGGKFFRKFGEGDGIAVYSVSKNPNTYWVQLLVDDNAPQSSIIAIEAKINSLKDDTPIRKYDDDMDNNAPIETPKHFNIEEVLEIRRKQKEGTLGRIERGRN